MNVNAHTSALEWLRWRLAVASLRGCRSFYGVYALLCAERVLHRGRRVRTIYLLRRKSSGRSWKGALPVPVCAKELGVGAGWSWRCDVRSAEASANVSRSAKPVPWKTELLE